MRPSRPELRKQLRAKRWRVQTSAIALVASAFFSQVAFAFAASQSSTVPPEIAIDTGEIRGLSENGVDRFAGIPFAAPPVGPLRWRAPQPVAPWPQVRSAQGFGPDCMQEPFPSDAAPLGVKPSEDCLYINVWRPAGAPTDKPTPVMVWIYGGGFLNGGSSPDIYSGEALAREGVTVVSFNYRVGRFGYFAHPQLTAAGADDGRMVNYGFMDQIAALQWVKRNISAFGGDASNITLVGESAGAMSVQTLMTSPLAAGLFNRAVIQSGGTGSIGRNDLASAQAAGLAFAEKNGIAADAPDALDRLRALSPETVTDGLNMAALFGPPNPHPTFTSPIADGQVAVDALTAFQNKTSPAMPVMIGATSDDIGGPSGYMVAGARQVADLLQASGQPVYYYRYGYVAEHLRTAETVGAKHATEIPYFFGTVRARYGDQASEQDEQASRVAKGYLLNFVKTGDPNGFGLLEWPQLAKEARPRLDFTSDGNVTLQREP